MDVGITSTKNLDLRDFAIPRSIVADPNNATAVDRDNPLTFLEWVQYFVSIESNPQTLLLEYKRYILNWQNANVNKSTDNQVNLQSLYVSLFRNIAVNILTQEEKRFITNADYTDPQQIAAVVPIFVRKIKDICLYYASTRDNVRSATYSYNIKGSNFALDKIIRDTIDNSFLDPEINKLFLQAGITKTNIKQTLSISFDELYDTETNYYDINPLLPASAYSPTDSRSDYFTSNTYDFDPDLFIDFDNSIVKEIQQYPVILDTLGANFAIDFSVTSNDLQFLKDQDFTNLVNTLDTNNLNLNVLKDTLQTFCGTTFYYLSTNNQSQFTYDKLFDADAFTNYLNRRFPTILQVESDKLEPIQQIGNFFRPDKLGIQNFLAFNIQGSLQGLSPDTIYVFPDPNKYGNITGLSRSTFNNPFSYIEDVSIFKNSISNTTNFGAAITNFVTKFKGYQSRSETLNYDPTGVSRASDNYEFFTGLKKTIWDHSDVFPSNSKNFLPIDDKTNYLLFNNLTQVQFKQDLYGSSFGLYKEINQAKDPAQVKFNNSGNIIYGITMDGSQLLTISGGTWNVPALSATQLDTNTGTFSSYSPDYTVPCIRFFPELDFFKTVTSYAATVYDGLAFKTSVPITNVTDYAYPIGYTTGILYGILSPVGYTYAFITSGFSYADGGPYLNIGADASTLQVERRYTEQNNYLSAALPSSSTVFSTNSGTLSANILLYNQYDVYGQMYCRSANDVIVSPASAFLSNIFSKYSANIQNEIFNKVKHFDIINNILVIETASYVFFEKLEYDIASFSYIPFANEQNYITKGSSVYNLFSNTWYDDINNVIYIARTNISPSASASNSRAIYFELYRYNGQRVDMLYPSTSAGPANIGFFSLSSLSSFSLSSYISFVNMTSIERPVLTYGYDTGKYKIKYLGKDPSNMFYDVEYTFKLGSSLYSLSASVYKPDMFLHSENFGNTTYSNYVTTLALAPSGSGGFTIANNFLTFN